MIIFADSNIVPLSPLSSTVTKKLFLFDTVSCSSGPFSLRLFLKFHSENQKLLGVFSKENTLLYQL